MVQDILTCRAWFLAVACTGACARGAPPPQPFGTTERRESVSGFTLKNAHGLALRGPDFGAHIVSLKLPDRTGGLDDVVLGHDSLAGYERASPYFGAIIGRYGN